MRIRIVSDGTGRGTSVVNAETGDEIEGVCSVQWMIDEKTRKSVAVIGIDGVDVDVLAEKALLGAVVSQQEARRAARDDE